MNKNLNDLFLNTNYKENKKKITNYLTNKELSIYEFLKWILTEKN